MSDTPQTILIQRRSLEDGLRYIIEHAKDVETAIFHIQALYREREREAIERAFPIVKASEIGAKQAIKEAILTEVIDPRLFDGGFADNVETTVHRAQRQRLDAWLGLEDTSNE